jgi:hypothetical protein
MYGMDKTTVYLPTHLKEALRRAARRQNTSEADLIRQGVALVTSRDEPPTARVPLFHSGQPDLATRVDDALRGFGER